MGSEGTVEGDGVGWDGAKEWPPRMALCVCVCEMTRLRAPGEWSETSRRSSSAPPLHQPATSEGHAEDKSSLPVSSDRRLPAYHRTIDTSIARSTSLAPVAMPPNPVSRTLSIALLIADTPAKPVLESKGDYLAIYTTWLQRSLKSIKRHHWQDKFTLDIRPFDVIKGQYPSDGQLKDGLWDAVMITGSASTVYGDVPWVKKLSDWIVDLAEQHPLVRICGYCWGHQLIAQAFGGQVIENPEGWELGVYDCELTEDGEEVFGFTKWDLEEESAGGKLQEVSENGEAESETKSVVSIPGVGAEQRTERWTKLNQCSYATPRSRFSSSYHILTPLSVCNKYTKIP